MTHLVSHADSALDRAWAATTMLWPGKSLEICALVDGQLLVFSKIACANFEGKTSFLRRRSLVSMLISSDS